METSSFKKDYMSKLQLFGRPFVVFDPANKDHRRWFADFNKNATWKNCPVRFVVNEDHGDLVTMIQRSLIQYYVDKEFKIKEPKPADNGTTRSKSKKAEIKHIRKVAEK